MHFITPYVPQQHLPQITLLKRIVNTSAPFSGLIKKLKNNQFYIKKNIIYTIKKLIIEVPKQFYHFWFIN
jgi:hypothetical protein